MAEKFVVRPARPADQPFLVEMLVLSMQSLPWLARRSVAELTALAALEMGQWRPDRETAFIAWQGDQPTGAIWLRSEGEANVPQYTLGLAVAPAWQRQGGGSALLSYALDFCRAHNGSALNLKVHPANAAAQRLYRRFGFEITLLEMKLSL